MTDHRLFSAPKVPVTPVPATRTKIPLKLAATRSLHGGFLEQSIPQWLTDASAQRRQALKDTHTVLPPWYQNATPARRKALDDSYKASMVAQNRLDKSMSSFQDIEAFARPLLIKALKDQHQVQVDVDKTLLCLRRPLEVSVLEIELSSFEFLKLSLLDAALHNFEAYECRAGAYHETSGFVVAGTTPDTYDPVTVNVTVSQFMTLCRSLDVGAQYQTYLQSFFYPPDAVAGTVFRDQYIASQKATMRAAAEQALLKKDIEPSHYTMILSVINGEMHPWIGKRQVWFRDLGVMKKRMTGCVMFVISEKYRYTDEWIIYIPHDPEHPFKYYRGSQDTNEFKRLLKATDAKPTDYQRFLSQFLPYDQRAYYFSQFTRKAADSPSDYWRSPWRMLLETVAIGSSLIKVKEAPPPPAAKLEPEPDPYIAPSSVLQRNRGLWEENQNLWEYLYNENRAKVLADARSHAVPSSDVDVKARDAKLAHLLQVGLLGLNMVSMFVPVLGEVMMVVMAGQLLYETLEGAIEWGEGDRRAAKDHLVDVAENLLQIAIMAGVGAGVHKFSAVKAIPVIERLDPVTLPDGETRLWKPDLSGYESSVVLDGSVRPNDMGQYVIDGKTYIRQSNRVYEQFFDASLGKWRIKHPTDASAYQPVLDSNGRGAWRHTLERPLQWDRLTLLRRMGHEADGFSDTELIKIADISGVSDNALRKMHVDLAPPPPELLDAMRLFKADTRAGQVIEQLSGARPVDELYLYALPLVTDMPRWPADRVLEVFDGPQLSGESVKYGAKRQFSGTTAKAPIQLTRAQILSGELTTRVLAGLDESEVTRLLGGEGARIRNARAQEFSRQIADYARGRQSAIFDSIYTGTEAADSRITLMQRICPGLSESAAREVLGHGRADDLEQLDSNRRLPLRLLEEARWYAREGRLTRAYAGLRSETIASTDSRRLALHTLPRLPGWPDNLRLEVRDGSDSGSLLDSIGSETARDTRYLIKKGPQFQAFNERGESLNSVPKVGDNFYASIMHALPDEARRGLGVPHVGQAAQLQSKIIEQADLYREAAVILLEPQAKWFKPPVRINGTRLGYPASGGGQTIEPTLTSRVRDVYPPLDDAQANEFIRQERMAGKSDAGIFNRLENLRREWEALNATLDQWTGPAVPNPSRNPWERGTAQIANEAKTQIARALKNCWRNAPLAAAQPELATLALYSPEPLPVFAADFSHIRELKVAGGCINDANADAFLAHFPNVERLTIAERINVPSGVEPGGPMLTNLPAAMSTMGSLKHLTFRLGARQLAADFSSRLQALTGLEELTIHYSGSDSGFLQTLDLTTLSHLRRLTIDGSTLTQWPANVETLTQLQHLDLSNTGIRTIPQTFYTAHDQLWSGLLLNWAKFPHEAFKPAFEYVRDYAGGHLIDLNMMVDQYCTGELEFLTGRVGLINPLPEKIRSLWNTADLRLKAVELLRAEHTGIFRSFYEPTASTGLRTVRLLPDWAIGPNSNVLLAVEKSWQAAVFKRFGLPGDGAVFELSASQGLAEQKITQLPRLPAGTFGHVETLYLSGLQVPVEQVRDFVQAFSNTRTLKISGNGLTEVPFVPGDLAQLTELDLSDNNIAVTPAVQAQFDGLHNLELLNAANNPLGTLGVTALGNLKALNLKSTQLKAWPSGAERQSGLDWIDLRDNQITSLPEEVLAHNDALIRSNLTGNAFSPAGEADLDAAMLRIESARRLPAGALKRFALEPVPELFPPRETGPSIAGNLLSIPPEPAIVLEGDVGLTRRVLGVNPGVTELEALQCISRLRSEGLNDVQIKGRLNEWQQDGEALTRQLNGWIYHRLTDTPGAIISARNRGTNALAIRRCWRDGLTRQTPEAGQTLNLGGITVGDLPELPMQLPGVRSLKLSSVKLTAQGSNAFLRAFPEVSTLVLSGNDLSTLPDAVRSMSRLERLELDTNEFENANALYQPELRNRLRWLDLSHNSLDEFSLQGFGQLENLSLAYNGMTRWPDGALEAAHLQTLNLSGNNIPDFPASLLEGNHDGLLGGTDLSDNSFLSLDSLQRIRNYSDANGNREVMGISRQEIVRRAEDFTGSESDSIGSSGSSDSDSDSDSDGPGGGQGRWRVDTHARVETPEALLNPELDVAPPALEAWLDDTPADRVASRTTLWTQLAREENHERFFRLLSTLRGSSDYRFLRSDLTHRVWGVIEAATENAELRELLFHSAEMHGACPDGRILSFSEMEGRVYEYNALRNVPRYSQEQRGRALLDLTRRLFRLERIDRLAEAVGTYQDRAEIRLEYRIGLTHGWPDGLELPGQPTHMLFGNPVRGEIQRVARASVLADEASDLFLQDLISRDYWVRYLTDRNPEAFDALVRNATRRHEEVEDAYPDRDDEESLEQYTTAMNLLEIELGTARTEQLLALTRAQIDTLSTVVATEPQPGPSRRQ